MENMGYVGIAAFMIGAVFAAGELRQRVKALEEWRAEQRADMLLLNTKLDKIIALFQGIEG